MLTSPSHNNTVLLSIDTILTTDFGESAQARLSLFMSNATFLEISCRGSFVNKYFLRFQNDVLHCLFPHSICRPVHLR